MGYKSYKVEDLSRVPLRYVLATALDLEFRLDPPAYGLGHRLLAKGYQGYFRPDVDWVQFGALLEAHWREGTLWLEAHFGPNWRDEIGGKAGGIQHWLCIAIVGSKLGPEVAIPSELQ